MDEHEENSNKLEACKLNLLDLPNEDLFKIFSFIDVQVLCSTVKWVCRKFYALFSDEEIFQILFQLKHPEQNIVNDRSYVKNWINVCQTFDYLDKYWYRERKELPKLFKNVKLRGHFAAVDAVHVSKCGTFCISGSRDRTALLWSLKDFILKEDNVPPCEILQGHKGWIWAIDSDKNKPNEIVTASWDKTVKVWDMNSGQEMFSHAYHPAAVLDLKCHDNVYTTACYDKVVRVFDPRANAVVAMTSHHKRPVISLAITDKFILTGSEDMAVGVFDVRAGKLAQKLMLDTPALCMNLATEQGFNYLRVGGKCGSLFLFDMTDDRFTLLNSTELWQNYKLTSVCNYAGGLIACSQSGAVRCFTPGRVTSQLHRHDAHVGDVTSCDANGALLVTGGCDNVMLAWRWEELS